MSVSDKYKEVAATLRKVASDLQELKKKKEAEKIEKCAAIVVAKVGLETLKEEITKSRR